MDCELCRGNTYGICGACAVERIKELEKEVERFEDINTTQRLMIERLNEKWERFRQALENYGRHDKACGENRDLSVTDLVAGSGKYKCTCGLEQALKGEQE